MVRRRLITLVFAAVSAVAAAACGSERDMPDTVEMPDSMPMIRALEHAPALDSMLDTMPGGEMARGDSAVAARLLRDKIGQ